MKTILAGYRKMIMFVLFVVSVLWALFLCLKVEPESMLFVAGMFTAACGALSTAFAATMSAFKASYAAGGDMALKVPPAP